MTKTDLEYAALVTRIVLGVLYVIHAMLVWTIFGLEHAAGILVIAELLGGVTLLLGLYARSVAIALMPIAIGTALTSLSECLFFAVCFAGQTLLASGALARTQAAEPYDTAIANWSTDISN